MGNIWGKYRKYNWYSWISNIFLIVRFYFSYCGFLSVYYIFPMSVLYPVPLSVVGIHAVKPTTPHHKKGSPHRAKLRKNKENTMFVSPQGFLRFCFAFCRFSVRILQGKHFHKIPCKYTLIPPKILPLWILSVSTPSTNLNFIVFISFGKFLNLIDYFLSTKIC